MRGPDLATIFDASPNPYMILDRDLRYVAANRAYLAVTSRRADELSGQRVVTVFPHDPQNPNNESARRLLESFHRVFETGEPDVLALIHYRIAVDGKEVDRFWSATHTPLFDDRGQVEYILQHTTDVTELEQHRRAGEAAGLLSRTRLVEERNAALADSVSLLQRAFDGAPGFMCFLRGTDLVFELASESYHQLVRAERSLVGRTLREAVPELGERYFALLDRAMRTGEPYVGRAERVTLAGSAGTRDVIVDFVYQPITDAASKPLGVFVLGNDITQDVVARRHAEELARVLDATHDFVGIARLDGSPTFLNAAGQALLGVPDWETASQMRVADCFVESERARVRDEVIPGALRDNYWAGELTFLHTQTGEHIPVLYSVFPLRDKDGTITALATITRDLRQQKVADAERQHLLAAERAARAQAEQANQLKDQFLATVSHELRTPLTAMLGWMQMLRSGLVAPEKQPRALETVERNARIQAQLIDDLLDVSRILSGKLDLDLEAVEIAAVLAAAVDTVRPAADAKSVELHSTIDSTAPVIGDPRRLQQVVWNLLSNAVKFTPAGGRVDLAVERREDKVVITVSDTGAGIPADFLPHVFERFRQAEGGSDRPKGGLGLGLSIVHHVVVAHGGTVTAHSDGPGNGARFVVTLPGSIAAPRLRGSDTLLSLDPPTVLADRRVVVVDDEDDTREFVAALLREARMHVTVAATAERALAAIGDASPELLLSDLAMPGTDGYALIKKLRALPEDRGGRIPAIALTAFARAEDRKHALRAGFQNHVAKPIDPAELFAVLVATLPPA